MDADERRCVGHVENFPLKDETYRIIGCAIEILNILGHGLLEKPYENAMAVEFELKGIPFIQQPSHEVIYKSRKIGEYVPDMIAFGSVIVEIKAVNRITDHERAQMLNYLKITNHKVGLILNFSKSRLEYERVVLS